MGKTAELVRAFARGMSRSRVSTIGALLVTVLFPALMIGTLMDIAGLIRNPYFGFIIYLVMGPLFLLGLSMIFIGLIFFKRREAAGPFTFEYLRDQFASADKFSRVRKLVGLIVFLTVLNVVMVALFSYTGFHYTESVEFCGKFCHSVMEPEYTAYLNSPHSRVSCVECHIGSGAQWYAKSKLSGARQFLAVTFDTFSRPISTPVHGLRPARETCEQCHRPEMFVGDELRVKHKYLSNEENTHVQTVLLMKIGSGGGRGHDAHGIHWHVSNENKIHYKHTDWERQNIYDVRLESADGSQVFYSNGEGPGEESTASGEAGTEEQPEERVMDCVDCHNRPTHIYLGPNEALDQKLFTGQIPTELPFIKRQAMEAVFGEWETSEQAHEGIESRLRSWYQENYAELVGSDPALLDQAVEGVVAAYAENVYPEMNLQWNTYRNHLKHPEYEGGCFRCHDDEHESEDGDLIPMDCDICHIVLAEEEVDPEILRILQEE